MTDFKRQVLVSACLGLAVLAPPAPARGATRQAEDVRPLFDVFHLEYESFPEEGLRGTGRSSPETKIQVSAARAVLNLPTPIGSRTTLIHGLRYGYLNTEYAGFPADYGPPRPTDLHAAGYSLTVLRKFSSSWLLHVSAGPEIASDFHHVDHGHWKVRGEGYLDRRMRRSLVWGFGAAYTDVTGSPEILPVLHLLAGSGGRARLEILVPYRAEAMVTLLRGVDLGLSARLEGDRYRLGRSGPSQNDFVRYSVATAGPSLELQTMNGMYLRLDAGTAFSRTLEIRDRNDDAQVGSTEPRNVFFLRGGLAFKI